MAPNKLVDTGIEEIDKEHRELLRLIQLLRSTIRTHTLASTKQDAVRSALSRVLAFSRRHFAEEEQMMQASDYPEYLPHKKEHDAFLARILNLQRLKFAPSSDSLSALENWLLYHVEGSDSKIVSHFLSVAERPNDKTVADLFG